VTAWTIRAAAFAVGLLIGLLIGGLVVLYRAGFGA
jgi:hypothetical protein